VIIIIDVNSNNENNINSGFKHNGQNYISLSPEKS
jgi:hypothetical protein